MKKLFGSGGRSRSKIDVAIIFDYESSPWASLEEEASQLLLPVAEFAASRAGLAVNFRSSGVALSNLLTKGLKAVESLIALKEAGRAEALGTGYSNSVLSILGDEILREQVASHREYVKALFDSAPSGFCFPYCAVSGGMMPLLASSGYDYAVLDDLYVDHARARELAEAMDAGGSAEPSPAAKTLFVPRAVSCGERLFRIFAEFTAFEKVFSSCGFPFNRARARAFMERAFTLLESCDGGSLVTLRFDFRSVVSAFASRGFGPGAAAAGMICVLEWLADSGRASTFLYSNHPSAGRVTPHQDRTPSGAPEKSREEKAPPPVPIEPGQLVRYATYKSPSLYNHFTASMNARKQLASLDKFYRKMAETRRLFSRILRAGSEKNTCYEPLIELARQLCLMRQYSLGSPEETERRGSHLGGIDSAGLYLSYIREMRTRNRGIFVYDIDSDRTEEIVFINEKVFLVIKPSGGIKNFIYLPAGMEAVQAATGHEPSDFEEPGCFEQYSVRAQMPDDLKQNDARDTAVLRTQRKEDSGAQMPSEQGRNDARDTAGYFTPSYSYRPSQSLMVGAQFVHESEYLKVYRGMSIFNESLIIRYRIKNTRPSRLPLSWKMVFRFSPDFLSVLRYGSSVLGFYSGESRVELGKPVLAAGREFTVLNLISDGCVQMNFGRITPSSVRADLVDRSMRVCLDYSLDVAPLDECNFNLSVSFRRRNDA